MSSELGPNWENITLALTTPIFGGKKGYFPTSFRHPQQHETIQELVVQGKFKPLIGHTFPLDQIREAFQLVASGKKNRKCDPGSFKPMISICA